MIRGTEKNQKVYVDVDVHFDSDGRMCPSSLIWEDGTTYAIDKVTDIKKAAAQKAGGYGDRYTIVVEGKSRYLFYERSTDVDDVRPGRWFLERK